MRRRFSAEDGVYLAAWLAPVLAAGGFYVWKEVLGAPTIAYCRLWSEHGIYCPGCGGTRAVIALFHGHPLRALYYHPAVPLAVGTWGVYLTSQTLWRLRGRRGWALHDSARWPWILLGVFLGNCLLRNLLLYGFGIPL